MAEHRHKRETTARRKPRAALVAGPLALLATTSAVTLGVMAADPAARDLVADAPAGASTGAGADLSAGRLSNETLSRSSSRLAAEKPSRSAAEKALRKAHVKLWTTAPLNLWTGSGENADKLGELGAGKRVLVTGRKQDGRTEIVLDGKARWVTAGYLSEEEPIGGDCTNGTSVPSGVSPNIVKVHDAVCAMFPEITTYGTFRGDGEHSQGIAVDIMVSGDRGWQVANFIRENYSELGVSYLIYAQQIWSVERGGEGWRPMSDRGSATANHYDHVHVTTY